jgi:hypothetical protein
MMSKYHGPDVGESALRHAPVFIGAILLLLGASAPAATISWTNVNGGDWSVAANWNPNQVPGAADDVLITADGNYTVRLDISANISSLAVGGGSGTQTLTNPASPLNIANSGVVNANGVLGLGGGTLNGTNQVSGTMNWTAGILGGPLTVANGGLLNILGTSSLYLYAPLTNAGTINWSNAATLFLYNNHTPAYSGAIYNLAGGLFNLRTDQYLYGYLGQEFVNNAGTVQKLGGTGTSTFYSVPLTNSGTVSAQQGTLSFQGGGTISGAFSAAAGAAISFALGSFTAGSSPVLTGPGVIQFTGTTLLLPYDMVPDLLLAGGTVNLGPGFQGGTITNLALAGSTLNGTNQVSGTMNWTAGILGGPLTVANGGLLNILGTSSLYLYAPLTNAGTINWSNAATLFLYNNHTPAYSGAIYNLAGGLFNLRTDQYLYGYLGQEFVNNAGTVQKLGGTGTSTFYGVPLTNSGTVSAQQGTLSFQSGFVQGSSATLASVLGGAAPGSGYGQIQFANPLMLAGTFAASTRNGFRPSLTDTFYVLTYPSSTGIFASLTGLDLGGGLWLQPNFSSTGLTLSVTTKSPSSRPQLVITHSGTNVLIQWPLGFPTWVLQSTTNLTSSLWAVVPGVFTNQALVPISGPEQCFRLISN